LISSLFFGITSKFEHREISIMSVDSTTKFKIRNGTADKFVVWEVWKLKEHPGEKLLPTSHFLKILGFLNKILS